MGERPGRRLSADAAICSAQSAHPDAASSRQTIPRMQPHDLPLSRRYRTRRPRGTVVIIGLFARAVRCGSFARERRRPALPAGSDGTARSDSKMRPSGRSASRRRETRVASGAPDRSALRRSTQKPATEHPRPAGRHRAPNDASVSAHQPHRRRTDRPLCGQVSVLGVVALCVLEPAVGVIHWDGAGARSGTRFGARLPS
jgi:hypothetical protein